METIPVTDGLNKFKKEEHVRGSNAQRETRKKGKGNEYVVLGELIHINKKKSRIEGVRP